MQTTRDRSGSFWLFSALIAASLVLLFALTWQSIRAARSHVRIVENVLIDYAGVASEQFTRYLNQYFGTWWSFQYGRLLIDHYQQPDASEMRFLLPSDAPPTLVAARRATDAIFRIDWPTGSVRALEGELTVDPAAILAAAESRAEKNRFFVLHLAGSAAVSRFVVFYPLEGRNHWYGVLFDPVAVNEHLRKLAREYQLLPRAIAGDLERNKGIFISLRAPSGDVLFEANPGSGENWRSDYTFVENEIEGDYRGLFSGFTVTAAIDPQLSERLIIGGLPRGRLPMLVTLLALTTAVLAALFWVLLKERALARMRNEFVARVSHEFRTPLTQIRMFAETLLLNRFRSEDDRRHQLRIIDREAKRLGHLVSNVLTLSGRDRRRTPTDMQPVDVCALLGEILDEYRTMLFGSTTDLELHGCERHDEGAVLAAADPEALTQVIINLIDNACKYGPAEQTVRVTFDHDQHGCSIMVEDEGPGIPEPEKERVWHLYYRIPRESERAINGTGIGLPIARELVESMGGHCHVEDRAGGGARFVVSLRRAYS
ncbi:MAG: sensor histidine kinase [Candidatus Wenzhouxiangella sp. M2_3B_020]